MKGSIENWLLKEGFKEASSGYYNQIKNEYFIAVFVPITQDESYFSYPLTKEYVMSKKIRKYKTFEEFKNKYESMKENE